MRSMLASLLLLAASFSSAAAQGTIRVAYAGSMGVVMDRFLGPDFAKANNATYQGIGQPAYALARLIAGKKLQADVFITITPGPAQLLEKAGLVSQAVPVASTSMVIAYSPKSKYAAAFESSTPWWKVLQTPGLRFGRTDPETDPQGRNIIFTFLLAERYYHQPGLARKILGPYENPAQIFTEPSLLSRLEAGQIDASSGYESAVRSDHLSFVRLPDEINLSNPAMVADWYSKVHFSVTKGGKTQVLSTQPLVFYACVPKTAANPALAQKFVTFLQSPAGQKAFRDNGYGAPKGGPV
ncbi:MAG TPA: extracellular solute-binding protein [Acetobacteraceae bacterium]|nr:extracellular solute-binding protein [Acetobacteraceae bacterium]